MRAACDAEGLYATDVSEALVARGVPFREAHGRTGALLKSLDSQGRSMSDLTEEEWDDLGVSGGASLLDPDRSVRARSMAGGPSPSPSGQADEAAAALANRTPASEQ